MNLINLVKITPLLMSSLMGINKANEIEPIFNFSITKINPNTQPLPYKLKINSDADSFPTQIKEITFKENNETLNLYTMNSENYNTERTINGKNILRVDIIFKAEIDVNTVIVKYDNNNITTTIDNSKNSVYYTFFPPTEETNLKKTYTIYADNTPIEPPEDPYKDYTNFDINQSRLQVIRTGKNTFSSYNDITRFNNIHIDTEEITINFQNLQYAKLNYTDKNITLPILGTFINNDTQLNVVDFYFTDNNSNVINLLNYISSTDMWYGSPTRNVSQSIYTYKNSSFNYFNNSEIPYKLNYTKNSDNTIQITTNDVGSGSVGNATIVNNENNLDSAFITSLFGIDPLTISYFGMPNKNIVNQLKSGGSVSAIIYQRVELANYNKYLPIYTYNPSIEQSKGELYIPLSNIPNNININIIAFRNDVNDDIHININDITTLFGVLDNLENLGLTPFTFGTIIFIGLTLGFIMVLIKILK